MNNSYTLSGHIAGNTIKMQGTIDMCLAVKSLLLAFYASSINHHLTVEVVR